MATAANAGAIEMSNHGRRALVWDARNTSTVLVARSLSRAGWNVDWMGAADSPTRRAPGFRSRIFAERDEALAKLCADPPDALFVHGDEQIRLLVDHWNSLPGAIRRHLAGRDALEIALSKERSLEHAARAGIPSLPTILCASPDAVAAAAAALGVRGDVVVKGEGGSAGSSVMALRAGVAPSDAQWRALTRLTPTVMVQRRLEGPRMLVTVVYERGRERAACAHEKILAYPEAFGITARGITRREETVLDHARRLFETLFWHGPANVEFRQDQVDGRWYFMEINPRIASSIGIQEAAGLDVAGIWAAVCAGEGASLVGSRYYREGVEYRWTLPSLSLALRHPFAHGFEAARTMRGAGDWEALDGPARRKILRTALWLARNS